MSGEQVDVFLDVDGVVNAVHFQTPPGWEWPDEATVGANGFGIRYSPTLVARLNALAARPNVQMHWLTTWEHDARTELSPKIGLDGEHWPVIGTELHYSNELGDGWWKWHAIRDFVDENQPTRVIWIDDDLTYDRKAMEWLAAHHEVFWVCPKTHRGLTPSEMAYIERRAEADQ